jgi:hypothetical protein
LPSNSVGTGPPGGGDAVGVGLGTTDGVSVAEGVDWLHDEATKTNAMPSREDTPLLPMPTPPLPIVHDWIFGLALAQYRPVDKDCPRNELMEAKCQQRSDTL